MSRDTWQQKEPAIEIRKLKKRIRLPVFSAPCGDVTTAVEFLAGINSGFETTNLAVNGSVAFTAEAFIKNRGPETRQTVLETYLVSPDDIYQWQLNLIDGKLEARVNASGVTTLVSDAWIPYNEWVHIAMRWDGVTLTLWINGKVQSTTGTPGGVLDISAIGIYTWRVGASDGNTNRFLGVIDEIKIWNIAKDLDEMQYNYDKPSATTATGLIAYLKFSDVFDSILTNQNTANYVSGSAETFTVVPNHHKILHDDFPPVTYGGSFVCAEFDITLDSVASLKFPNIPPADCNFALMVRWVDDNDLVQRRLLWDSVTNPSIIALPYSIYNGELLPLEFTLEIWSDPYAATADLTSTKDLFATLTTDPTTSKDVTPIDITVPAVDTTLAEAFPLVNAPYEFNTQQTY